MKKLFSSKIDPKKILLIFVGIGLFIVVNIIFSNVCDKLTYYETDWCHLGN